MSIRVLIAIGVAFFVSACAQSGDVVSSRSYASPVFVPDLSGPR